MRRYEGAYDLALIDYKMTDMNGFGLYTELRKLDTRLKVCFITAYEIYLENARTTPTHYYFPTTKQS
ncbi:response regulator [Nitrososphaera sp. AFS]|uniref:response regulator n=1 Tax=Nitrososphaera sp. AFS TaxID=2301191 RepID=UPI00139245C0|nr:response regulator [Nitrososphaera sp. AFS]